MLCGTASCCSRRRGNRFRRPLPVSALRGGMETKAPREWLVDFEKALAVGMAISVHLNEAEPVIDQLFVLGVSGETDTASTAAQVSASAGVARPSRRAGVPPAARADQQQRRFARPRGIPKLAPGVHPLMPFGSRSIRTVRRMRRSRRARSGIADGLPRAGRRDRRRSTTGRHRLAR